MEIVFILIPVSLVIVIIALWAFVWAVRNDQFEDLDKEAFRVLFDQDRNEHKDKGKGKPRENAGDKNKSEGSG